MLSEKAIKYIKKRKKETDDAKILYDWEKERKTQKQKILDRLNKKSR